MTTISPERKNLVFLRKNIITPIRPSRKTGFIEFLCVSPANLKSALIILIQQKFWYNPQAYTNY
ncbi:hypothetical protein [Microcoleus sp. B5-D4]|uniref:hypothetical protein n=1 Tax=Microcoleus sp. B5-D4 TaxID=2818681 RepID=UPI002FD00801